MKDAHGFAFAAFELALFIGAAALLDAGWLATAGAVVVLFGLVSYLEGYDDGQAEEEEKLS